MRFARRGVFVAVVGVALLVPQAPSATAAPNITLGMSGSGFRVAEDSDQIFAQWTCSATSTVVPTLMTTILSCTATFGTFTSPAPAPVPVYGPAAATGSAITVQSTVQQFTLCMTARITRPLAPEITESACEVFEIG